MLKNFPWIAATITGIYITPSVFRYAFAMRGYKAIGGEIFVPFLVPLVWYTSTIITNALKNAFTELDEEANDECRE
jgi:hypothetical protein